MSDVGARIFWKLLGLLGPSEPKEAPRRLRRPSAAPSTAPRVEYHACAQRAASAPAAAPAAQRPLLRLNASASRGSSDSCSYSDDSSSSSDEFWTPQPYEGPPPSFQVYPEVHPPPRDQQEERPPVSRRLRRRRRRFVRRKSSLGGECFTIYEEAHSCPALPEEEHAHARRIFHADGDGCCDDRRRQEEGHDDDGDGDDEHGSEAGATASKRQRSARRALEEHGLQHRFTLPASWDYSDPDPPDASAMSGHDASPSPAPSPSASPSPTPSDPDDEERSGCQVNLAFEEDSEQPAPAPLDRRFIDITKSDYDHLPWYFQDSEDDLANLSFPEEELPSKRPHSIAAPGQSSSASATASAFLRGAPARATATGAPRRARDFNAAPERPVSAADIAVSLASPEPPPEAFERAAAVRASAPAPAPADAEEEQGRLVRAAPTRVSAPATRVRARPRSGARRSSAASSDGEIDWSWVAREAQRLEDEAAAASGPEVAPSAPDAALEFAPSAPPVDEAEGEAEAEGEGEGGRAWLRASMRRVQPFRLAEPSAQRVRSAPPGGHRTEAGSNGNGSSPAPANTPLPPLAAQVIPCLETTRPLSASAAPGRAPVHFPRRYSASPAHRAAPAPTPAEAARRPRSRSSASSASSRPRRRHSAPSSSSSSDSEDAAAPAQTTDQQQQDAAGGSDSDAGAPTRSCNGRSNMAEEAHSPLGHWPHNLSSMLASLGCTLGLFNISRFAIFSVQFGANFIVQFLLLTVVLGIPLYTFHSSIGQFLAAGVMDMWKISPVFQGIGIALLVSQALIGIYSIVGVSWMFIYFRDSFITKQDRYRWAEPSFHEETLNGDNVSKLEHTVSDYLSGTVLQRDVLANPDNNAFGHLKFQVTFNLAVVWMIVFVSLSKGLKSYGKVVYVFSLFPVFGMLILCTKLLGLTPSTGNQVFPETVWSEFFLNTKCWVVATTEVFFTWGLLGASMMQISSHNRHKHLLQRDVSLVVILTIAILLLAAFLANTCVQLLAAHGYSYVPSSFEHTRTYSFLRTGALPLALVRTPVNHLPHTTFICGVRISLNVTGPTSPTDSGYQVLRLATEVVPSTFALLGADQVSPFWAVLFYFVLILFGIAQQLAIWHCVITGIMAINATNLKSWETTITFFSCACGFILGLPMTTELGIFVVYFMDYTVGCGWWLMIIYLMEIGAIFVVRGRPYSGENVVTTLLNKGAGCLQIWAAPMLVFTWNVILPVALMVVCITIFKQGRFRELYNWSNTNDAYWPLWCREIGCLIQIIPIVTVPLVCIVQTCRYLSDGPPDIFDRIQLLYRPSLDLDDSQEQIQPPDTTPAVTTTNTNNANVQVTTTPDPQFEDPPPKYTPPPSYTTATGARIAKLLRQSFRRSMRRITNVLGDNSEANGSSSPRTARGRAPLPPPPDYAAVLVEINQALEHRDRNIQNNSNITINVDQDSARTGTVSHARALGDNRMSTLTAADVAHILRSSLRRTLRHSAMRGDGNEQLVHGAAPINQDTLRSQAKTDEHNTSVI